MKALMYVIVFGFLVSSCTTKKDVQAPAGERSTSSQNDESEDDRQIRRWDELTAAGTVMGELPEMGIEESETDAVEADILGVESMIHKASFKCKDLHVTVNKSAKTQTLSAKCDGTPIFGPVLTSAGTGSRTPLGTFKVYARIKMAYSGRYRVPLPRFLVFKDCGSDRPNCIGIHATAEKNYPKLGTAASKGCVRLTMANAVALWNLSHESETTQVTVL